MEVEGLGDDGDEAQSIGSAIAKAVKGAALPLIFIAAAGEGASVAPMAAAATALAAATTAFDAATLELSGRPEVTSSRDIGDSSVAEVVDSQADIEVEEEMAEKKRESTICIHCMRRFMHRRRQRLTTATKLLGYLPVWTYF